MNKQSTYTQNEEVIYNGKDNTSIFDKGYPSKWHLLE